MKSESKDEKKTLYNNICCFYDFIAKNKELKEIYHCVRFSVSEVKVERL